MRNPTPFTLIMPNIVMIGANETEIGSLRFTICHDREELEGCHCFRNSLPSLEQSLHYVGLEEVYPVAFLIQITINKECRLNKENRYGSTLLGKFEDISTDYGAKMAACKVGWIEGESTRAGNFSFYKTCGWDLYDPSENEPVMAFKMLDTNAPKKALKLQLMAKMDVYWNDENFDAPFAPKLID